MREIVGKPLLKAKKYSTMRDMLVDTCKEHAVLDAFIFRRKPNLSEIHRTFSEFEHDLVGLTTYINNSAFAGKKFAVLGENAYEWFLSYSSVLSSDSVVVPLDKSLPEGEIINLLERSGAEVIFYHHKEHKIMLSIAEQVKSGSTDMKLKKFVLMSDEAYEDKISWPDDDFFDKLDDWKEYGYKIYEAGDESFYTKVINPDDVRIILFTSGTTAMSKGVLLTNRNILSNVYSISTTLYVKPGERDFSVLPLHHTFENTCDFFLLSQGVCICIGDGLRYLVKNMEEWHVEAMVSVPLLFENIYGKINDAINSTPSTKRMVDFMLPVTKFLFKCGIDVRRAVFSKILNKLGGHIRLVVIGGAAIDKKYIEAFNDFGIDFLMGYGLTETSPVISVTTTDCNVYGSVGRPITDVKVKIDNEDGSDKAIGEIMTLSDCVFKGYFNNEEATKEALEPDGWFHTGDMGYIDKKGAIHVTGRVKSMIVLNNGKKAFPEEIETLAADIDGVSEAFVWGCSDDKNQIDICALILINRKAIGKILDVYDVSDDEISAYLDGKIKDVNHNMPSYKGIKYFVFTEEDMIKTTTLKIKRPKEQEKVESLLYNNGTNMKAMNKKNLDTLLKEGNTNG
ncbi:MAG: AMP-binding protein [Clostridia bacterium]|nr:AMP-binding protein [Clostridia bacterium]